MQLTPIASNMTEVETSEARILFSYRTPVAAYVFGRGYVRTAKWWSVTTSRHINQYFKHVDASDTTGPGYHITEHGLPGGPVGSEAVLVPEHP